MNIVMQHPTGERRSVPVEYVTKTYVAIRWGLAGLYDLNLRDNVLTARSAKTQAKGKAKWYKKDTCLWRAEDINAVRKMVADELSGTEAKQRAEAMARHAETMPGGNPGVRATVETGHSDECECEGCLTLMAEI